MNTPTPRTNRAWNILGDDNAEAAWSFARTLERELAESRNAERLARVQLAAEREKVKRLVEINEFVGSAQLKAEREKVRLLRLACDQICEEWGCNHDTNPIGAGQRMATRAGKALAATEGAK
jgi:hypothetical protein